MTERARRKGEIFDLLSLGWLRDLMQEDAMIRATVMAVAGNNGYDDLGRFAFEKRKVFVLLTEGLRDLVEQS
jgi:hypothetical protein